MQAATFSNAVQVHTHTYIYIFTFGKCENTKMQKYLDDEAGVRTICLQSSSIPQKTRFLH